MRGILSGLLILIAAASAASADLLYGIDDTSLYTVDPLNGVPSLVGPLNPPVEGLLGGLEWANGLLYGLAGTPGNALWTVDPTNGVTRLVGPLNVGAIFEGGLAYDGEVMWGVNQGIGNGPKFLIRIDLATGAGTVVGQIGLDGQKDINGMAMYEGDLYGIDRVTNALWRIDRQNPVLSNQVGWAFGGSIDLGVKGGMAGAFAYADDTQNFFRVDFVNGGGQPLAGTSVRLRSLAPISEPAGLSPLGNTPRLVLEGIQPNPTSGWTEIRFHQPEAGPLSLGIFDAGGRLIRILAKGPNAAGHHANRWDERDTNGELVPPGIYFVRGLVESGMVQGKIVVLR